MTITAPMFSDLNLSDPEEMMKVTNNGTKNVRWIGVGRREYVIEPAKSMFIPFHIIVRYLGDPRSDFKKTETFQTPSGDMGVIPERRGELIRLSILYGLYHGNIPQLPKKAPKVTVTTLNDVEIDFPIFNPQGKTYKYTTLDSKNIDVRTELERLQNQIASLESKQTNLINSGAADDPDAGEAPEDSAPGM
jgi:hypothetical protein